MKTGREADSSWLISYMSENKWRFIASALLGTFAVLCAGALLFTSGYLISRSALRPENVLMVYVPIVLVRAFGFSKAILHYVERLVGHNAVLRVLAQMRVKLYEVIEPQALRIRSAFRSGELLNLLAEDIEQLQNVYLRIVLPSLTAILIYAAGIAAIGSMDGMFAWLMALYCGFLLFIVPAAAMWTSISKRRRFKKEKGAIYQELTDAVFGMSDWIVSGRSGTFLRQFYAKQSRASAHERKLRRSEWLLQWLTRCAAGGAVALMVVWAGELAADRRIEVSWIAAIGLVAFPLMDALIRVADAFVRLPDYQDSLKRLKQIEIIADNGTEGSESGQLTKPEPMAQGAPAVTAPFAASADLRLERVSFRYPNVTEWSVRDVSIHAPQGYKLAVLGRSGAGKSTLLNLILGELQPEAGIIAVDARPVRASASSVFSVLNQKPYLFDTSVANNIRLGRSDATDEEIRSATEQVGLHQLIASLPNGYDTRMEEAGSRFSGGERQRIALARILLQNHPIVLLDEPTVGLDPITETQLVNTMFRVLEGKTVIWFTHHLIGVERMDEVIFMDKGAVAMRGKHEELIQRHDRYRRLVELDYI